MSSPETWDSSSDIQIHMSILGQHNTYKQLYFDSVECLLLIFKENVIVMDKWVELGLGVVVAVYTVIVFLHVQEHTVFVVKAQNKYLCQGHQVCD